MSAALAWRCADCRQAALADGFCGPHGRGFVGGRAYLSRLAYHLARDESRPDYCAGHEPDTGVSADAREAGPSRG